ncbi:MAG TPA: OFA family MFS transporter, partial [Methylophilaceae bacterium]|nr:OFA family MFS transporter [Methylophilaceae bacterium]
WVQMLFTTACDWDKPMLGWMYTLFFVFLGSSAAIWGGWLEHAGPRKAGFVAAVCWCGGLLISALGIYTHQLWLMWLGSGVIGGIGLGLGYISPVSTLIKWFPDRRGMATGMAIMGFGGGAMIGSPLADSLMRYFATPTSVGVWETFVVLALGYFVFMMVGAFSYRVPPTGWKPANWNPPPSSGSSMITTRHVHLKNAHKTPQFWLLWAALCLNVSAGIGVIGMASPMLQEIFGGKLIGLDLQYNELNPDQLTQIAAIAAGFIGLLSLFNIMGRFMWASFSDYIGRKATYFTFFTLGFILYATAPWAGHTGNLGLYVALFCIILTMYGGGFATIPAYLADMFGTQMVGAIHGRILTAWAAAGVLGPVLVNYINEYQINQGVPKSEAYDTTMYVLAGLLIVGFVCNLLVRPVAAKWFMNDEELAAERKLAHDAAIKTGGGNAAEVQGYGQRRGLVLLFWLFVGIPLAYGIWNTLTKAWVLFH